MGYLHDGHLSLVRAAREQNRHVVASIFVNPAQFGPNEDLASYPRDIERDVSLLGGVGADAVFIPREDEIYPEGFVTSVDVWSGRRSARGSRPARPFRRRGYCRAQALQPGSAHPSLFRAQRRAATGPSSHAWSATSI